MGPNLKKSRYISATLYMGTSKVEADATNNYLKKFYDTGMPMPVGGTDFSVIILDIINRTTPDIDLFNITYKVEFKGEVV